MHLILLQQTTRKIAEVGGQILVDPRTDLMNQELSISLVLSLCQVSMARYKRWNVRFDLGLNPDITMTITVRMKELESAAQYYYILPTIDIATP